MEGTKSVNTTAKPETNLLFSIWYYIEPSGEHFRAAISTGCEGVSSTG
jgi:hypothetical protein